MLNPNEIGPKHLTPLQAAVLKHRSVVDEHVVSKLYKLARALFVDSKTTGDAKVFLIRSATPLTAGSLVTASCTDAETGLFVQLSGVPEDGVERALMTFGQKFCQEIRDAMKLNIATKIW